jgi:hypothetical protein
MRLVYIAHPLGHGEDRDSNITSAEAWVAWAAEQGVCPIATWVTLARRWPETPERRELGLRIDFALIEECDELWLCGGRISPGMALEARHAGECGIVVRAVPYMDPLQLGMRLAQSV